MDVKDNLAKNLSIYRKSAKLTQAELAEKLNYSDKAVSKWERGEAVPDLYVLKQLADFYGVKIDTLISTPKEEKPHLYRDLPKKRKIICLISTAFVWLIAVLCYFFINIFIPSFDKTWLFFLYAVPVTLIVLLILTSVWGKNFWNMIFLSVLLWTSTLCIFLSLTSLHPDSPDKLWEIFLIAIPLQVLIAFWYLYKRIKIHK